MATESLVKELTNKIAAHLQGERLPDVQLRCLCAELAQLLRLPGSEADALAFVERALAAAKREARIASFHVSE